MWVFAEIIKLQMQSKSNGVTKTNAHAFSWRGNNWDLRFQKHHF